ncbi:hypothetical protein [Hymenobacter amundsenii]|uniref:hypothetical protein n=1 Tax=Hymenobacter amundsenii TaxID=2006685 RepID=UPI0013FE2CE8|nr:hypothetical protein [Hymenobacter amundsenii]
MNDDNTLAQQMVAAAPAASRNVNLNTDSKRMAVINVWDAMFLPSLINCDNVI